MYILHAMQLSSVDLNLLVVLDALLDTQSVQAAGRKVALSASATSHALARLRELFADPLLVRAGKQLVLTARGAQLKPRVHQLLEETKAVLRETETFEPQKLERTLHLACTDYAELLVLPALSRELARSAPGLVLHSRALRESFVEELRGGQLDLALGVFQSKKLPDDIHTRTLYRDEFVTLLRKGHPALKKPWTVKLYAQLEHVLASPRGGTTGVVDEVLAKHGHSRKLARVASAFAAAPELVAGTDYVLTISERLVKHSLRDLGLVVRRPPVPVPGFAVSMAWHRRMEADPLNVWVRGVLTQAHT